MCTKASQGSLLNPDPAQNPRTERRPGFGASGSSALRSSLQNLSKLRLRVCLGFTLKAAGLWKGRTSWEVDREDREAVVGKASSEGRTARSQTKGGKEERLRPTPSRAWCHSQLHEHVPQRHVWALLDLLRGPGPDTYEGASWNTLQAGKDGACWAKPWDGVSRYRGPEGRSWEEWHQRFEKLQRNHRQCHRPHSYQGAERSRVCFLGTPCADRC